MFSLTICQLEAKHGEKKGKVNLSRVHISEMVRSAFINACVFVLVDVYSCPGGVGDGCCEKGK